MVMTVVDPQPISVAPGTRRDDSPLMGRELEIGVESVFLSMENIQAHLFLNATLFHNIKKYI